MSGSTRIGDIVKPAIYLPYFEEQSILKSQLIQSGVVEYDPRFDALARSGGNTINMPFFQDLSGTAQVPASGTASGATDAEMTVSRIGTSTDVAALIKREMAWGSEDLAFELAGSDPLMAIANMELNWWLDQEQTLLINTLGGVFATACSDLIFDASTASETERIANASSFGMQADYIIDAAAKLGDHSNTLTAICMHSVPFTRLQKENLIDYEHNSVENTFFPYYLGYRVLVDDKCPAAADTNERAIKYTSYLFARGAIARGEGIVKVPIEVYRKPLASLDVLIRRRSFILHPRGNAYQLSPTITPTTGELANGDSWARVFEKKNMRVAALKTNL